MRAVWSAGLSLLVLAPVSAAEDEHSLAPAGAGYVPGQVLVRYDPGTTGGERADVREELGAGLEQRLPLPRLELLDLGPGATVASAVRELEGLPQVRYAEPNFIYRPAAVPDDPLFDSGQLWGLNSTGQLVNGSGGLADADIDAPEAWDTETGSSDVVIAVVDTGVSLTHDDLDDNLWINAEEASGTPGVDDAPANGFIDDVNGWDFAPVEDDPDPTDEDGHGSHVAGTIAAEGDNSEGIAGVNWDAQLMALRVCSFSGCTNADIASAFTYAGANGADVVNASISGGGFSSSIANAISAAPGTLFVVSAGNDASDNDADADYPCSNTNANLICVAASDRDDELASFSNFGGDSVDLAAPGVNIDSVSPLVDVVHETFASPLGPEWTTGGTPNIWNRTSESSAVGGTTLTDSPGDQYQNDTDNHATLGPTDLTGFSGCHLRYEVEGELPDVADELRVQTSTDNSIFTTEQTVTGTGTDELKVDLSPVDGQATVWIRFNLVTNNAFTGDGVHIDDLRLRCPQDDLYEFKNGTSMASPHVAGAAALLLAHNPAAGVSDLRSWLLDGVDRKASLDGLVAAGGRLNLRRSLDGAGGADIHRPETAIVSGPTTAGTRGPATFSFSSSEPSSYRCRLDGGAAAVCASPRTYRGLALGAHTLSVHAVDTAGNVDLTPVTRNFAIAQTQRCKTLKRKLRRARTKQRKRVLRRKMRRACRTF